MSNNECQEAKYWLTGIVAIVACICCVIGLAVDSYWRYHARLRTEGVILIDIPAHQEVRYVKEQPSE